MPALSISISSSRPASRTSERMTPSAVGERQMLPMQMNRMRVSSRRSTIIAMPMPPATHIVSRP